MFIVRGFNEESEYTLTAKEVQDLEEARTKTHLARTKLANDDDTEDMGLIDFIKIVIAFVKDIIVNKRWRKW